MNPLVLVPYANKFRSKVESFKGLNCKPTYIFKTNLESRTHSYFSSATRALTVLVESMRQFHAAIGNVIQSSEEVECVPFLLGSM